MTVRRLEFRRRVDGSAVQPSSGIGRSRRSTQAEGAVSHLVERVQPAQDAHG